MEMCAGAPERDEKNFTAIMWPSWWENSTYGQPAAAAAAAVCALGLCGERAAARMGPQDGNASYRNYLIDAVFRLTPEDLEKGARYEVC